MASDTSTATTMDTQISVSPFLDPGPATKANSLAIIQLSRDNLLPIYLQEPTGEHDGYAEGAVVNTRYGSFPHSTLLDVPWGSQIRASKVDTGSRGRKRKRPAGDEAGPGDGTDDQPTSGPKQAVVASSGFVHVLPPTPELWTASLPHRTQVVYTPDYSYILHRIRARPGTRIIEAGAGSGSFTHASVRAVYNGYPRADDEQSGRRRGKVFSFEFHEQRYEKMKKELEDHGMRGLVQLTHRDVYNGGFLVDGASPEAEAVFLDLPKPWEALPHLSRRDPRTGAGTPSEAGDSRKWVSPLNPKKSVYICTFSPCIEQVSRTVSAMRRLGWVDIEMVEIMNRKLQVFRERIGLNLSVEKGANIAPANVAEAVARLAEIEDRFRENQKPRPSGGTPMDVDKADGSANGDSSKKEGTKAGKTAGPSSVKSFMEGRLITRGEPEIKTHTSYLVFAVLPREWTEEDEAEALKRWPCGREENVIGGLGKEARRQENRDRLQAKHKAAKKEADEAATEASEA